MALQVGVRSQHFNLWSNNHLLYVPAPFHLSSWNGSETTEWKMMRSLVLDTQPSWLWGMQNGSDLSEWQFFTLLKSSVGIGLRKHCTLFDNFLNFLLAWTYTKEKTHLVLEPVQLYTMFPVVCHFLLSRKKTFLFLKIMQMEFFQRHTFWWMQVQKLTVGKLTFHDSTLIELELDPFDDIRVAVCLVWSKLHHFFHNTFYRLRSKQLTILLI